MDVTAARINRRRFTNDCTQRKFRKSSAFSIELFSEFQSRISSYLLCRKNPLQAGPQAGADDLTSSVLTGRDSMLIGPTAFLCFILVDELEAMKSAPVLNALTISSLLNRHSRAGLPLIERVLRLGVEQGLLQLNDTKRVYGCSNNLKLILADCNRLLTESHANSRAHSTERRHDAMCESDPIGVQIKRAYLAHKNGQIHYVLESTAVALKALRGKEYRTHQTILDQKVLLLSLRARALMQFGRINASDACMHAAIKCMAVSAKRHPLPA